MYEWIILATAAFFAGILNAIAGGGSFLTLPALIYAGVPPVAANATSALVVLPGYLGSTIGFKDDLLVDKSISLTRLLIVSIIGGFLGSQLLLLTSDALFKQIIPFLMIFATLTFIFGPDIVQFFTRGMKQKKKFPLELGVLLVTIYGGYFNGGLGIILLAVFSLMGMTNLHTMNGLKSYLSFILTSISVLVFIISGLIFWKHALVMMFFSTVGGFMGAKFSKLLPKKTVRMLVIIIGLIISYWFWIEK